MVTQNENDSFHINSIRHDSPIDNENPNFKGHSYIQGTYT